MSIAQLEFAVGMDQSPITSDNLDRVAVVNLEHYVALTEGLINVREPLARSSDEVTDYDTHHYSILMGLEDSTLHCAHESVQAFLTKPNGQLRNPNSDIVIRSCMLCLSCDALILYAHSDSIFNDLDLRSFLVDMTSTGFSCPPEAAISFAKWAYANWPYYLLSPEIRESRDWDPVKEQALGECVSEASGVTPNELQFLQYFIQVFRKNTMYGKDIITPLHVCAVNEWPSLASWFLRNGVDANHGAAALGKVALALAMRRENLNTATVLVQHPSVNPNLYSKNDSMQTYFFNGWPNRRQLLDFEKALFSRRELDLTSEIEILSPSSGVWRSTYPILEVALHHPRLMNLLLLRGDIDVTVKDVRGYTALHHCSGLLHSDAVAALAPHSQAVMDHFNYFGRTALMDTLSPLDGEIHESKAVSLLQLKRDCVKLLIQHGADCSLPNFEGQTALDLAENLQGDTQRIRQRLEDQQNQLRNHIQLLAGNIYINEEEHLQKQFENYTPRMITARIAIKYASEIVAVLHHAGARDCITSHYT